MHTNRDSIDGKTDRHVQSDTDIWKDIYEDEEATEQLACFSRARRRFSDCSSCCCTWSVWRRRALLLSTVVDSNFWQQKYVDLPFALQFRAFASPAVSRSSSAVVLTVKFRVRYHKFLLNRRAAYYLLFNCRLAKRYVLERQLTVWSCLTSDLSFIFSSTRLWLLAAAAVAEQ